MSTISKFELHYYFNDNSHSMDALVRNSCEREFLKFAYRVLEIYDIPIKLESEAYTEGGLREYFKAIEKFAGKNKYLTGLLSGVLLTAFTSWVNTDYELSDLQKQQIRLEIEKSKLELKKELRKDSLEALQLSAVKAIESDLKLIKHRSNFFEHLIAYHKVNTFSTTIYDKNGRPLEPEKKIPRASFNNYIVSSNDLSPEVDEQAVIEIISPVLKSRGNYKWRGVYKKNEETISFYVKDSDFRSQVFRGEVTFNNGIFIECELQFERRINEVGEIENHDYQVIVVNVIDTSGKRIETQQGIRHKRAKEDLKRQIKLDFDEEQGNKE